MRIISTFLLVLTTSFLAASETNVSGFLDAGFSSWSNKAATAGADEAMVHANSGWLINSGAVYLSHKREKTSVFVDLPVARTAGSNQLTVGMGNAQAYIKHMINDNLSASLGQFDTIYGFELNDSKDRFFSYPGTTYTTALPTTHAGLLLQYSRNNISFDLMSANANGNSSYSQNDFNSSPATGLRFGWNNEKFRASLGYLMTPAADKDGKPGSDTLVDVVVGATFGKLNLDLEMDQVTDSSITEAGDVKKTATAMMLLLTYMINEKVHLGLRYDSLAGNQGGAAATPANGVAADSATETAIGVNYNCDESLDFRLGYHMYSSKATKNATESNTGKLVTLGGVYTF